MSCPNCDWTITPLPNADSVRCPRCGTTAELMSTGHIRRIRIPTLTQQATPAELAAAARPEGACT